jgi:dTDP-4-amino-4,6-dideoxygalactose transaminase
MAEQVPPAALPWDGHRSLGPQRHRLSPHHVVGEGFKANMPDILAAIGIEQLKRAEMHKHRNRGMARYRYALRGCMLPPWQDEGCGPPTTCSSSAFPTATASSIAMRAKGVACGVHYEPIHHQKYWISKLGLEPKNYPNAEAARRHCVSLPLWSGMTEATTGPRSSSPCARCCVSETKPPRR